MNDKELLIRYAQNNDEQAFGELVKRYYPLVHRTVTASISNAQTAEDVSVSVFEQLARSARNMSSGVVIGGWLFKTAHFLAQNAYRQEMRRRKRDAEALSLMIIEHRQNENVSENALFSSVESALMGLNERDRNAVVLRHMQGMSLAETAEALGISKDAAEKRVSRGLERLRSKCAKAGAAVTVIAITEVLAQPTKASIPLIKISNITAPNHLRTYNLLNFICKGTLIMTAKKGEAIVIAIILVSLGGYITITNIPAIKTMVNNKIHIKTGDQDSPQEHDTITKFLTGIKDDNYLAALECCTPALKSKLSAEYLSRANTTKLGHVLSFSIDFIKRMPQRQHATRIYFKLKCHSGLQPGAVAFDQTGKIDAISICDTSAEVEDNMQKVQ